MLKKVAELEQSVTKKIKNYEFGQAAHELYELIWHDYADIYIEATKNSESVETKETILHCTKYLSHSSTHLCRLSQKNYGTIFQKNNY